MLLASVNLLRTKPRLQAAVEQPDVGPGAAVLLRRLVCGEVLLVAGAVAAAALLSSLPPPPKALAGLAKPSAHTGPGPVTTVVNRNGYRLEIRVTPNRAAAQNTFSVRITRGGAPVRGADVLATFTMLDMEMPAQSYRLAETAPGVYERAAPALVMVGHWGLTFQVQPQGRAPFTRAPRRPGEWMRATVALVLLAAALACAAAPSARADGDPASDYLLTQKVFFPFDLKVTHAQAAAVHRARRRGESQGFPDPRRVDREPVRPRLDHEPLAQAANVCALPRARSCGTCTRTGCWS